MPFAGYYNKSDWTLNWVSLLEKIRKDGLRNIETTTIAPTGSISMFFDVSSGIEPQFSLVFEKRVVAGNFFYVDIELNRYLKEENIKDYNMFLKELAERGSVLDFKEDELKQYNIKNPIEFKKVFLSALDLPWWDHIRAQAEIQKWISHAVSKTINMSSDVEVEDVMNVYLFAHGLGCKGTTVYREGSRFNQVLNVSSQRIRKRYEEVIKLVKNKTLDILKETLERYGIKYSKYFDYKQRKLFIFENGQQENTSFKPLANTNGEVCPSCGSKNLVYKEGCVECLDCGWSKCDI